MSSSASMSPSASPNTSTRKRKGHQQHHSSSSSSSSPPPHSRYHRMLFIGQAPGPKTTTQSQSTSTTTTSLLLPPPALEGLAGSRLARLAGLPPNDLWDRCDRINLLSHFPGTKPKAPSQLDETYHLHQSSGDTFNLREARAAADVMDITSYNLVVLLGLNVARAFRLQHPSLFAKYFIDTDLKIEPCPNERDGGGKSIAMKSRRKGRVRGGGERGGDGGDGGEMEKEMDDDTTAAASPAASSADEKSKSFEWMNGWNGRSTLILVYPHPSGVSHFWNSRANRVCAMNELRSAMVDTGIVKRTTSAFFSSPKQKKSKYFQAAAAESEAQAQRTK